MSDVSVYVGVDFPEAENVWRVRCPVEKGGIAGALEEASANLLESLAQGAGRLAVQVNQYAELKRLAMEVSAAEYARAVDIAEGRVDP